MSQPTAYSGLDLSQHQQAGAASSNADCELDAQRIFKTYRLGKVDVPVLRGASLQVKRGEWVAVLGASGSGKSTLLHIVGGLDRAGVSAPGVEGSVVKFRGQDLFAMTQRQLDRYRNVSVGFVFQFYHLLPELSVVDNALIPAMVRFGRFGYAARAKELRERASELLSAFGLGHRLRHRPAELSGGERQRVAIARALINDPPVLLADEPTGNLDRKTGAAILDQLAGLRQHDRRTLVMVTHDRDVAARADRIVEILDGEIVNVSSSSGSA